MPLNGEWTDFISDFMDYTVALRSPDLHRKWTAIALAAMALERRVWSITGDLITYPNLYILLVASPGIGKGVINLAESLLSQTLEPGTDAPSFRIAASSVTAASLVDNLAKAKKTWLPSSGPPIEYNSLAIISEEFEVLLPAFDRSIVGKINKLWNNIEIYTESRRTGRVLELAVIRPQLNILAGLQPSYFVSHFPEEAWATGFCRRIIMVYAAQAPLKDPFARSPDRAALHKHLLRRLAQMALMIGEIRWDATAYEFLRTWYFDTEEGRIEKPSHSKLASYNNTRLEFLIKLSNISAISRTGELHVELLDCRRALEWLLEVEALMPDIFREMQGRSDWQVIEELHLYLHAEWTKGKMCPVRTSLLEEFLAHRLPSEKVPGLLLLAERANVICRAAGMADGWLPRPKHQHNME